MKSEKSNTLTYAHFDPTDEQLSNSYVYLGINPGSSEGKYINRKDEVSMLRNFLNVSNNGKKLNKKYSSKNFSTWGNGKENNFLTDGCGRVKRLDWNNENLSGSLDLSDFTSLKSLMFYKNNITKVNLKNCNNLKYVSFAFNDLKEFSCTSNKLISLNLRGNKLTNARFKHNNEEISMISNNGGTFSIVYNNKQLTIYAQQPPNGYKFVGIYNDSNELISKKSTVTFKPTSNKYFIKYDKI